MSTLLLLASAFAQDCTPSRANLVAAPAPDATDVPPDISPVVMFPDDPCREDVRVELVGDGDSFPYFQGDLTRYQLAPWNLRSSASYEVHLYAGDATEPFTSWSFETAEDIWAEPLAGPSNLRMDAWFEDLEDGTIEQVVVLIIEPVDRTERVIYVEHEGKVLWAGNPRHIDLESQTYEVRYEVGAKQTPYCVNLVDLDEQGGEHESSFCTDQAKPGALADPSCSTGPLFDLGAWLRR